jgi:hypothetical protein
MQTLESNPSPSNPSLPETNPSLPETNPSLPETPAPIEAEIELAEELTDEVDEVAEALAAHDIISEERHEEIINEVNECRLKLEQLSTAERAENPILSRIQEEVRQTREQVAALASSLESMRSSRTPSESAPAEPVMESSTAEPEQLAPQEAEQAAPKRRRFTRI